METQSKAISLEIIFKHTGISNKMWAGQMPEECPRGNAEGDHVAMKLERGDRGAGGTPRVS